MKKLSIALIACCASITMCSKHSLAMEAAKFESMADRAPGTLAYTEKLTESQIRENSIRALTAEAASAEQYTLAAKAKGWPIVKPFSASVMNSELGVFYVCMGTQNTDFLAALESEHRLAEIAHKNLQLISNLLQQHARLGVIVGRVTGEQILNKPEGITYICLDPSVNGQFSEANTTMNSQKLIPLMVDFSKDNEVTNELYSILASSVEELYIDNDVLKMVKGPGHKWWTKESFLQRLFGLVKIDGKMYISATDEGVTPNPEETAESLKKRRLETMRLKEKYLIERSINRGLSEDYRNPVTIYEKALYLVPRVNEITGKCGGHSAGLPKEVLFSVTKKRPPFAYGG